MTMECATDITAIALIISAVKLPTHWSDIQVVLSSGFVTWHLAK
jgi:hypothetical protein